MVVKSQRIYSVSHHTGLVFLCPQERRASFLKWLHTQLDKEGLLKCSKAFLKVVPSTELQAGPPLLPKGTNHVVTKNMLNNQNIF